MSDLTERLRNRSLALKSVSRKTVTTKYDAELSDEAADEIERLQRRANELEIARQTVGDDQLGIEIDRLQRELADASSARDAKLHSLMVENSQLKASKDYWEKEAKALRSKAEETLG